MKYNILLQYSKIDSALTDAALCETPVQRVEWVLAVISGRGVTLSLQVTPSFTDH